jgi:hypothetical protein
MLVIEHHHDLFSWKKIQQLQGHTSKNRGEGIRFNFFYLQGWKWVASMINLNCSHSVECQTLKYHVLNE